MSWEWPLANMATLYLCNYRLYLKKKIKHINKELCFSGIASTKQNCEASNYSHCNTINVLLFFYILCYIFLNLSVMYFTIIAFLNFGLWFTLLNHVGIMLFCCSVSPFGLPWLFRIEFN